MNWQKTAIYVLLLVWMNSILVTGLAIAQDHSMVFMSDPQLGWQAYDKNVQHAKSVLAMAQTPECRGIVIVGDLTDFGRNINDFQPSGFVDQLGQYQQLYESSNATVFPALGNHDYGNNVDDSAENRAPTGMVEYLINSVQNLKAQHPELEISFDMSREDGYEFPTAYETIKGSLAYSWNIGNIHYVHLNNYPMYQRSWSNYRSDRLARINVDILPSWEWLDNDLSLARKQGKSIIINFHDPGEHWGDGYSDAEESQ
jgi:cytolysin (calcineurin-like family phosphatase)